MEYVFGTNRNKEVLKTKGDTHTNLTGYHEVVREYPDQTITDNFRIVAKTHSDEDSEGNCYDWYEIDHHYRITDKSKPINERIDSVVSDVGDTQDALCEASTDTEERLADIEDALCELSEG